MKLFVASRSTSLLQKATNALRQERNGGDGFSSDALLKVTSALSAPDTLDALANVSDAQKAKVAKSVAGLGGELKALDSFRMLEGRFAVLQKASLALSAATAAMGQGPRIDVSGDLIGTATLDNTFRQGTHERSVFQAHVDVFKR